MKTEIWNANKPVIMAVRLLASIPSVTSSAVVADPNPLGPGLPVINEKIPTIFPYQEIKDYIYHTKQSRSLWGFLSEFVTEKYSPMIYIFMKRERKGTEGVVKSWWLEWEGIEVKVLGPSPTENLMWTREICIF